MDEITFWGESVSNFGTAFETLRLSEIAMDKLLADSNAQTNIIDARKYFRPRDIAIFLHGRPIEVPPNDFWAAPVVTREQIGQRLALTDRQIDRITSQCGVRVSAYGHRRFICPADFAAAVMKYKTTDEA